MKTLLKIFILAILLFASEESFSQTDTTFKKNKKKGNPTIDPLPMPNQKDPGNPVPMPNKKNNGNLEPMPMPKDPLIPPMPTNPQQKDSI